MRVLVLDGNENQAVAATRSLSRAGHRVIVGSPERWSKAGWSRHAHGTFRYPAPQEGATAFVGAIASEAAREPGTLVMPMTERSTLPLSERRGALDAVGAHYVLPAHEVVLRAFDKRATTVLAAAAGVTVPATATLGTREEAQAFAAASTFPVVLKPASSEETGADGRTRSTGAPEYARSREDFLPAFERVRVRAGAVLVQEFIAGSGAGYFALVCRGEVRAEFAHRRIRDVRPSGSGSAVRESVLPDPRVREASRRILAALGWHGVAMVEFRIRPDGTPVFLEVNGRFWNSLALAVHAGVDFPSLVAALASDGDVPLHGGYATGVRCRWILGDVRHLVAVWAGPPAGYTGTWPGRWHTLAEVLRPVPGMRHDNFALDDPLPELGDWVDFLGRKVPRALRRRAEAT